MKALHFEKKLQVIDIEKPSRGKGEVLIRVTLAGICNTDHEITRGYVPGFNGVPGHEFIGVVEESEDASLVGKKVTAEINCACGVCDFCETDLGRHCPDRTVFGIIGRNGAFAEYTVVPADNVVEIPDTIPDERAIFIEPLAAACEILEQVEIGSESNVLLFGDGKLAVLIARVLHSAGCTLTVVGKHNDKLGFLSDIDVKRVLLDDFEGGQFDVVVEASGNSGAFEKAMACVRPRGTLVLKSTYAGGFEFNPARMVVNEITIVGSRCGQFKDAIHFLNRNPVPLEKMISSRYPLSEALKAFEHSLKSDAMKVLIQP